MIESADVMTGDKNQSRFLYYQLNASEIYIGSSNISKSALTSGIEWNYRFSSIADSKSYHI